MKNSTIVGLAVGAALAVSAVVCYHVWKNKDEWDQVKASDVIAGLTDDYNTAITEHPSDRGRAKFAFDVLAANRLKDFTTSNSHFMEFTEWKKQFDAKCKDLHKAIRKP